MSTQAVLKLTVGFSFFQSILVSVNCQSQFTRERSMSSWGEPAFKRVACLPRLFPTANNEMSTLGKRSQNQVPPRARSHAKKDAKFCGRSARLGKPDGEFPDPSALTRLCTQNRARHSLGNRSRLATDYVIRRFNPELRILSRAGAFGAGTPLGAISGSQMKPEVNKAAFRPATRHPGALVTLAQEASAFARLQSANLKHNRK